ncbi:glutaredoxin domain-containing protein [Endothiovibrio diazotrophicus]
MKRMIRLLIVTLAAYAGAVDAGATFYKWKDANGQWHYSDQRPAGVGAQMDSIEAATATPSPAAAEGQAAESAPKASASPRRSVVMYSAAWCGVCKRARAFMTAKHIPFREYDIEKTAKGKRDYQRLNGKGVPLILVGEQRMSGFSGSTLLRWLGRD